MKKEAIVEIDVVAQVVVDLVDEDLVDAQVAVQVADDPVVQDDLALLDQLEKVLTSKEKNTN